MMLGSLHMLMLAAALTGAPEAAREPDVVVQARRIEAAIDAGELAQARRALAEEAFPELVQVTLEGRLALAEGKPAVAERRFRRAMELAPNHAPLRILRAHALLASGRESAALEILAHDDLDPGDPAIALLRAAAHDRTGDPGSAYAALQRAAIEHDQHVGLRRELVLLCARHGLFGAAQSWASTITPADLGREAALLVLQQARGESGALELARWLAAGFPDDPDVQAQLGWVCSAAGRMHAAAEAFEHATRLGADTAFAAAEHHRAARRHRRALAMNGLVSDRRRRAEQRFDILFESGAMARAIVAADALVELSARRRYELSYAHYVLGQYAEATEHARALEETSEAERAAVLLRAMRR
jgi:tetratricopeptide (TPR) repeat protein